MMPGDPGRECPSTAQVRPVAQSQFLILRYDWDFEGQPQDGMIVFPSGVSATSTRSVWLDSWHMANAVMICHTAQDAGLISLRGSYPAPPGPDWGWRIEIEPQSGSRLVVRMFNITPSGEEALAVLAEYAPAGG